MTTIEQGLQDASSMLFPVTRDRTQAWLEAELLLSHVLQKERVWLLSHSQERLKKTQQTAFTHLVQRRQKHEPLAYLFGEAPFYGRIFYVNRQTLIPRLETEQLVEDATSFLKKTKKKTLVWDVGTGSGIVGITLKLLFPQYEVIATDLSSQALKVARKNATRLLKHPIGLFRANLLDKKVERILEKHSPEQLLVIANLPYLPPSQKRTLARQVRDHEPLQALFAPQDGRALNEKLIMQLTDWRRRTKIPIQAFLEFDPSQAKKLNVFSQRYFPHTKIVLDLHHRERFLQLSS